jgi:hypothetical protein
LDLTALDLDNLSTDEEATLSGTGEPGSEVEVVANGEVISTTTVDDEGNWRLAYLFSESGDYELQVRTLDADGAVVNESEPVSLSVTTTGDATSEEAPTLAEPELEEVITDEAINLAGTGEPGGEVQVLANDDLFGVAPVEEDGTWEYAVAFSEPGDYDLTVRTVDADGNITSTSEAVSVSIAAPSPSETFAFIFPADGADIISGQLTIIGTANAGQEIEVLEGATVLGTAETSGNGEWFFIFEPEDGNHTYTARLASQTSRSIGPIAVRVVSASGEVDCSSNLGISRGDNYIFGTCNTFGTVIERTGVGLDALIEANPQIPNPDLIYPGDVINVPR